VCVKTRSAMHPVLVVAATTALWLGGATPSAPALQISQSSCVTDPVVTSNSDTGAHSLRDAIDTACDGSKITFEFANTVASRIVLTTELAIGKSLTVQGPGANVLTISGNHVTRVFHVGFPNPVIGVTLSGLTIADGRVPSGNINGGGIWSAGTRTLTITNCAVSGNSVSKMDATVVGAGIYISRGGTVNVIDSLISDNSASSNSLMVSGSGSDGGGIFNDISSTLNITNSTFFGNSALGGGIASASGGAIYNEGTLNVTNSTFSGNIARGGGGRGGVGGGITSEPPRGTASLRNTLIAGNTADGSSHSDPDVSGPFISHGYNLIGKSVNNGLTNGVDHDQVGVDPMLDPGGLQDNGGPTLTIALLPGSPAIDQGGAGATQAPTIPSPPISAGSRGRSTIRVRTTLRAVTALTSARSSSSPARRPACLLPTRRWWPGIRSTRARALCRRISPQVTRGSKSEVPHLSQEW